MLLRTVEQGAVAALDIFGITDIGVKPAAGNGLLQGIPVAEQEGIGAGVDEEVWRGGAHRGNPRCSLFRRQQCALAVVHHAVLDIDACLDVHAQRQRGASADALHDAQQVAKGMSSRSA
jgi:hypothetical protein